MYYITQSEYFNQKNPPNSEELRNFIEVPSLPLQVGDFNDRLYKSSEAIEVSYENRIIEIKYTEIPAINCSVFVYATDSTGEIIVDDTTGLITNATIPFTVLKYAWGCIVTLTAYTEPYCVVLVKGYPLKVQGKELANSSDATSITENGLLKYKFPENHLIQSRIVAKIIATTMLGTYKSARKDIHIDWCGNPALILNDIINCVIYNKGGITTTKDFFVYKQTLSYDGGFREKTIGRIYLT